VTRRDCRAVPQHSPPSLLDTAACGGLRSTSDCRPRRTYLHLSYSYAAPCGPAILVTHDPLRKSRPTRSPRRRGLPKGGATCHGGRIRFSRLASNSCSWRSHRMPTFRACVGALISAGRPATERWNDIEWLDGKPVAPAHNTPGRCPGPTEAAVFSVRADHPIWGAR
jgi:hypothetical protein